LAIPSTIIAVPFLFSMISFFQHVIPAPPLMFAVCLGIAVIGLLIRKFGAPPVIHIQSRQGASRVSRKEWILIPILIVLLVAFYNLPRVSALWDGASAQIIGSWDTHWHLEELVSVAKTGLPPAHYFFPDIQLGYYYWSLVLPAIVVNQTLVSITLAQALAIHSILQGIVCMAITYWMLRLNFAKPGSRILGFVFLTMTGGFDYFVNSNQDVIENWQRTVSWLISRNEIAGLPDRYSSTPQHLAGFLALLLAVIVLRNIQTGGIIKTGLIALFGAFILGTSPTIFIVYCLGIMLWLILYRKIWWRLLRREMASLFTRRFPSRSGVRTILMALALIIVSGIVVLPQLRLTGLSDTHLLLNNFRIPFAERFFNAETDKLGVIDWWGTIAILPLITWWIILIEIGAPVLIFSYWLVRNRHQLHSRWLKFVALFPILNLLLTFLVRDSSTANNFSRNAALPAQLFLVLGALTLVESIQWHKEKIWIRMATLYLLTATILLQMVTPCVSVYLSSRQPLGAVLGVSKPITILKIPVISPPVHWPEPLEYILWANATTPSNAVFLEEPLIADDVRFRRLERLRYFLPEALGDMTYFSQDAELLYSSELGVLKKQLQGKTLLEAAKTSGFIQANNPPLYYVSRSGVHPELGVPVYSDATTVVYRVDLNR
jgi:hypothetical protein